MKKILLGIGILGMISCGHENERECIVSLMAPACGDSGSLSLDSGLDNRRVGTVSQDGEMPYNETPPPTNSKDVAIPDASAEDRIPDASVAHDAGVDMPDAEKQPDVEVDASNTDDMNDGSTFHSDTSPSIEDLEFIPSRVPFLLTRGNNFTQVAVFDGAAIPFRYKDGEPTALTCSLKNSVPGTQFFVLAKRDSGLKWEYLMNTTFFQPVIPFSAEDLKKRNIPTSVMGGRIPFDLIPADVWLAQHPKIPEPARTLTCFDQPKL